MVGDASEDQFLKMVRSGMFLKSLPRERRSDSDVCQPRRVLAFPYLDFSRRVRHMKYVSPYNRTVFGRPHKYQVFVRPRIVPFLEKKGAIFG